MGSVIDIADRLTEQRTTAARPPRETRRERRFRYPGPDAVSEVSCEAPRRRRPHDEPGDVRRAG
jgi:hypothetical protein